MSNQVIVIGTYSAIYVGDYNSSSALEQLRSSTTNPFSLIYEVPETNYLESVDGPLQADRATLQVGIELLNPGVEAKLWALGNLPSSTGFRDQLPEDGQQKFSVLLVHSGDTDGNVYIPKCMIKKRLETKASKKDPTTVPVQLYAVNRNRHTNLYYERSLEDLVTIMGSKYPL